MKEKYSVKLERGLSFIFKIILLLYLYFQSMVIFHNTVFIGIALWGLLLVGAVVCILRVFLYKSFVKTGGIILLGLFLLSYAIAIFTNMEYGLNADIANWVILALTFAVIYLQDVARDKNSVKKEMAFISKMYIVILDVSVLASLIMLVMAYGSVIYYDGYQLNIGFVENRLWGIFIDPNVASVFSVVAIIISVYYIIQKRSRVFYGFTTAMLLFYIGVADSRTGVLCLFFSIGFLSFMYAQKLITFFKKKVIHYLICFLLALVIGGVSASIPGVFQNGYNMIVSIEDPDNGNAKKIERNYNVSEDISNKRFAIWQSGIEIFSTKPLTGIGFHHLKDYVDQELPDTYLAQDGVRFSHLHNEILNVLVSQGIIGLAIIVAFAVTSIVAIIKKYLTLDKNSFFEYTTMITCLLCICIGMMLQQGILYFYMPINLIFWMYLGYMRLDSRAK